MLAVVLGAGEGKRLRPVTSYIPKPLIPLGDGVLIDHVIEPLLELGIERVVVPVGYLGDLLSRYLGRRYGNKVIPIRVERRTPGNLSSFLCARELCEEEHVLITNADHIFSSPSFFYEELLYNTGQGRITLAGHRERVIGEDEMKVVVSPWNSLVVACKRLKHYHGAYVGACVVPADVSVPFFRKAEELSRFPHYCVEDLFCFFPTEVIWLDKYKLYEIDTLEDWRKAKEEIVDEVDCV